MKFGELITDFENSHLPHLAAPTRSKYISLIRCHVRPQWGGFQAEEITRRRMDEWLAKKTEEGLSWETRSAMRKVVCSIFTRAEIWETYDGRNPAKGATVGRKKAKYEKRKLTADETKTFLLALPGDVRLICMVALFCGLRISEVMGLCWKHVDFERGMFLVRQRYWRGDVDLTKTDESSRDVPFCNLEPLLNSLYPGPEARERFCFEVQTRSVAGHTRDDRSIRRNFLRPIAKKLGIYYKGFGFHALRREAITFVAKETGAMQASKYAGHSRLDVTLLYILDDHSEQARAITKMQLPFVRAGLLDAKKKAI